MRHAVILKKESSSSTRSVGEVVAVDEQRFRAWEAAGICRQATPAETRTGKAEPPSKKFGRSERQDNDE